MPSITYKGLQYPLATSLRVAYNVQGLNNHASYIDIFRDLGTQPIEKQVEVLYVSFSIANPSDSKAVSKQAFLDDILDTYNLNDLLEALHDVITGIMGPDVATATADAEAEADAPPVKK